MSKKTIEISPEQKADELQGTVDQYSASLDIAQRRIAELVGYEKEANSLRDEVAALRAQNEQLSTELSQAQKNVAAAEAVARNAATTQSAGSEQIQAARDIARGLQVLAK